MARKFTVRVIKTVREMRMVELEVEVPTPLEAIQHVMGERKELPAFDAWTLLDRRADDTDYKADEIGLAAGRPGGA